MTLVETVLTIILAAGVNHLMQALPFLIFGRRSQTGEMKSPHPFIVGFGEFLPPAIMWLLVVYCYRKVDWFNQGHGLAELGAGIITAAIHLKFRNTLLSLVLGTGSFILLTQIIK